MALCMWFPRGIVESPLFGDRYKRFCLRTASTGCPPPPGPWRGLLIRYGYDPRQQPDQGLPHAHLSPPPTLPPPRSNRTRGGGRLWWLNRQPRVSSHHPVEGRVVGEWDASVFSRDLSIFLHIRDISIFLHVRDISMSTWSNKGFSATIVCDGLPEPLVSKSPGEIGEIDRFPGGSIGITAC